MANSPESTINNPAMQRPVALVTGGSRGIGRGICLALAQEGYAVAINFATNEVAAKETQRLIGQEATTLLARADLASTAERDSMVDTVLSTWGRIDVLVNNAAISSVGRRDILESSEESWDRVLAVDLKGPFFLSQRVAREMISRRDRLQDPAIVNISSLSAYAVSTNRGDYCVAKAGLSMATKLFAVRLAEHGIRVYEVRPGIIATDMTAGNRAHYDRLISEGLSPIRRWGTADDVGQAVAALVTGHVPFSTGNVVEVDGGFHIRRL